MASESEWRAGIKSRYLRVEKLLEESAKDPPNFPYKSKYEAREVLRELYDLLREASASGPKDGLTMDELNAMLAGVVVMIASADIEVEEPSSAEANLKTALSLLEIYPNSPLTVNVTLSALNRLGFLWSQRGDNEKGLEYLQKAESCYLTFVETGSEPRRIKSLFTGEEDDGKSHLEQTYTYTLYYLAQVFKSLKMDEKSALYCHWTLKRQVEFEQELDRVEWAVNAAAMSQYLAERNAFKEARHHLAAADYFMQLEEKRLNDECDESEEHNRLKETLARKSSDVARCWAKYCLLLLCMSRDRLMGSSNEDHGDPPPKPPEGLTGLSFPTLDLREQESVVSCDYALDYDDAKKAFLFGQKCCNKALVYNTLDGQVTDHVNICMDLSQLYRLLAFFEENEDSQCKMHKRRLDLLSKVVSALNPQYYMDLCRGLWMELGTTCLSMAEIKLSKISSQNNPEAKAIAKANGILQEGIDYVEKYIHSYDDKKKLGPPDRYPEEVEKDVVSAYLLVANMYMKFLTADKVKLLYCNSKSLDLYKAVVEYCKRNEEFKELEHELRLSEEMVLLLPAKLARIQSQIRE